jgi:uncharacterized protein DUF6600/FecR-like protein
MRVIHSIGTSLLSLLLAGLPAAAQQAADPANTPGTAPAADSTPTADTSAAAPAASPAPTVSAHSRIRIVRLSEVKGEVQLDRNTGKGFETPMANLPIVEGDKLKTGNGVAEVEFEDNSTIRVAQNSLVAFPKLELLPGGAKASSIQVLEGMVYVYLMKTKDNQFTVAFGKETINLPPDSHVRLQLTAGQADLAVLHGDALVAGPAGTETVGKNKTATFNLTGDIQPQIAKDVAELPMDAWDHDAVQYHKSYANASAFGGSPYSYGINDMNYYGSFINASGCGGGSMWRPYFTGASWDPYGSGAWAYYPSAGYSWVSPYPWGWTPFHSGSWAFCQGVGWGWRPGGPFMGLGYNVPVTQQNSLQASSQTFSRPRPPMHPPVATQSSLIPVNLKALPASSLKNENTFMFRNNSAGFGVPRGSLGKLNGFSGQAATHGTVSTPVFSGVGSQHGAAATAGSIRSAGPASSVGLSNRSASPSSQGPASSGMSHASSGVSAGGGGAAHGGGGGGGGGGRR